MVSRQSSSDDADAQISAITQGRAARTLLKQLQPIMDSLSEELISRLCVNHSSFSDAQLRGLVGELAGLRKLRDRLNNRINAADAVSEEI